jgi:hypothetical protein
LFDETGLINAVFVSKADGKVYTIRSGQGTEILLTRPDGSQSDPDLAAKAKFQTVLAPKEVRAMLLDLGSLRPITKGIILDNIPPGSYRLSVEFPSSGVVSNAVDVDILKPSEAERVYLKGIQSLGPVNRGDGVNWSKVLRDRMAVPENASQIRAEAQDQLRFHTLLSKIVRSEIRSSAQTKTTKVPDYLKEEKDCLLLELDENSGKKPSTEEKKAFKDKNPGFEWRFRDSQKERADFLLYRVDNKKS